MITPATSLISLIIYSFFIANLNHIYLSNFLIIFFSIFLIKRIYIKEILILNIFVLFIVIPIYFVDIEKSILILLRANLIIFFSLSLFYKQDLYKIIKALNTLKINKKFVAISFFTIKSIDTLLGEIKKINKTLKARGFNPKSNIFTYKIYANMFAIIIIKSIYKSKQFNKALISRGFIDEIYLINNNCFKLLDILFILSLFISLLNIGLII